MKKSITMGLRERLVMIILIIGLGGEIGKFGYDYLHVEDELSSQGAGSVNRTLYGISGVIDKFITHDNFDDVQWLLENLTVRREVIYSALVDPEGIIISSNERKFIGLSSSAFTDLIGVIPFDAIGNGKDIITWQHNDGVAGAANVCVLVDSALRQNQCYKFLHWESYQERRAMLIAEIIRSMALQIILITLLSLGVWLVLGAGVVSRAQAIYEAAKRYERGDLNARASLHGNDEFALIGDMVDKSYARLTNMIKQIITAFNTSTLHSDPFTAGHEERVSDLCRQLGQRAGLSNVNLEALSVAAQVHDIGQSEVPAEIMLSPKHLSDEEFAFIRQHCEVGADILSKIDFPWPISTIVLQHHENFDGSGYPAGLCGDEICIESRIIRLADCYESLISHRPHRDAMSIDTAKAFIGEHAGRYFDPVLVKHLFDLLEDGYQFPEVLHIKNMESRPDFVTNSLLFNSDPDHCLEEADANLALRENLEHAELVQAVERSIEAIAKTLELRDPYTAGHQKRVADFSVMIGREMGMSDFDLEGLRLAAVVHDIGKIKIPISILTKPRRLNEVEYRLMRTHPRASYDILKGLEMPWPLADIAHQHHEAWDGSGYPQGLKGENILLQARIMMVADIVESMSSSRPYRPALGVDAAVSEIKRLRGTMLDPNVVDAFIRCLDSSHWAQSASSFVRRSAVDI